MEQNISKVNSPTLLKGVGIVLTEYKCILFKQNETYRRCVRAPRCANKIQNNKTPRKFAEP